MRGTQPLVLSLESVHGSIKFPEILVSQKMIVDEVELPPGVRKRVAVALSREIHPPEWVGLGRRNTNGHSLGVSEFIAFKVEVGLSAERVNQESGMSHALASFTYRIILCNAMPRSMIGVKGLRSDM